MGISEYEKDGKSLFKVIVNLRSDCQKFRVQKQKAGLTSRRSAEQSERLLYRECERELFKKGQEQISWGDLVEAWELAMMKHPPFGQKLQRTTVIDRVNALIMYTKEWWDVPSDQISRSDVLDVFEFMNFEGKSKARKKDVKAAMNSVFNWAIDSGKLINVQVSPANGVRFAKEPEAEPEILSLSEIRSLLRLAKEQSHPWYPVWSAALMTGMRSGELYALKWKDIDWESKRLMVSKSYSGRLKKVKSTKAGYWRDVPINEELLRLLKDLRAQAGAREEVLSRPPGWGRGEAARHLRMFCEGNGLPSIRFHALRACFATQLIRDAVAPAIVMKICGWKDIKTMQRYIRLAGIEIEGATTGLKILPEDEVMGRVFNLFTE